MGYAALGLFVSDKSEEKFGMVPTDKDKEDLKMLLPQIRLVENNDKA